MIFINTLPEQFFFVKIKIFLNKEDANDK